MKILTKEQITAFKTFIDAHSSFIITGHKEPDGDCIASSLGIARLLKACGKDYCVLNAGPFKRTEIRPYERYFTSVLPKSYHQIENPAVIIVDCSELSRLGDVDPLITRLDTYILDHHKTAESTEKSIIDSTSPAASCIVQQLYEAIVGPLDKETAEILFFGLSTDTGFFRFLDTNSAEVFMAASRLLQQEQIHVQHTTTLPEANPGVPANCLEQCLIKQTGTMEAASSLLQKISKTRAEWEMKAGTQIHSINFCLLLMALKRLYLYVKKQIIRVHLVSVQEMMLMSVLSRLYLAVADTKTHLVH